MQEKWNRAEKSSPRRQSISQSSKRPFRNSEIYASFLHVLEGTRPEFCAYFDSFWARSLPFQKISHFGHYLVNSWISSNYLFQANLLDSRLGYPKLTPKRSRQSVKKGREQKRKKGGQKNGPKNDNKTASPKKPKRRGN